MMPLASPRNDEEGGSKTVVTSCVIGRGGRSLFP
jgi:hypothetical protein